MIPVIMSYNFLFAKMINSEKKEEKTVILKYSYYVFALDI